MIQFKDIVDHFNQLMDQAARAGLPEPDAFALATTAADGRPAVRMLLLKGADERGFVFYTNLDSRKARELRDTRRAAMCFRWTPKDVQVRIEGRVEPVSEEEADAYFASRPRGSQIGAWASRQSSPLASRQELLDEVARVEAEFVGQAVPRPPFWSGFRLVPDCIEFWFGRESRLHERFQYRLEGSVWVERILAP
jgi:pyridoxamine 5'-phosphate oxidase